MMTLNSSTQDKGRERISYLTNAALWLLPFLAYALFVAFDLNFQMALLLATVLGGAASLMLPRLYRHRVFPIYLFTSESITALCLFGSLFIKPNDHYFVYLLPYLLLTLFVVGVLTSKRRFVVLMQRVERRYLPFHIKANLYEFFNLSKLLLTAEVSYLVIASGYLIFLHDYHTPELHHLFLGTMQACIIGALFLYCHIRISMINHCFQKEEWLPIINDDGKVIGKVARHISYQEHTKFLHPHLRVLIFNQGRLFIRTSPADNIVSRGLRDTSYSHDLFYSETFTSATQELNERIGLTGETRARFFTRYLYQDNHINRIIFLYTLIVTDEEAQSLRYFRKGKFWNENEIELNLGKGVFSSVFEEEYELLRDTVFPVMKMMG